MQQQQKRFDRFRKIYNEERPHEGVNMQRPARLYKVEHRRPYPAKTPKPHYAGHFETRRVAVNGGVGWNGHEIFISRSLGGHTLGFQETDDGIWDVHFYRFIIGKIDERKNDFL